MAKSIKTSIQRIAGPAIVGPGMTGATDVVAARIDEEDEISNLDTHGCYDQKKGTYTIPISGIYQVSTIVSDGKSHHVETNIVQKRVGDTIQVTVGKLFENGDYVFIRSNDSLGIYNDKKIKIIESQYPMLIGTEIDPRGHSVKKVAHGSKLASILVLYGKKVL